MIYYYTRFSDRVFIPHAEARRLLTLFCTKGLQEQSLASLINLLDEHAKCVLPLLKYLLSSCPKNDHSDGSLLECRCPQPWTPFIQSLASTSPVCTLIHTTDELESLLRKMQCENFDVTRNPECMKLLQHHTPVLFNLLKRLEKYPHALLAPILHTLLKKVEAPFVGQPVSPGCDETPTSEPGTELNHLSFFPKLPPVRGRNDYAADGNKDTKACNKYSHGHPSLLPGVFTVFCQHGESHACERI